MTIEELASRENAIRGIPYVVFVLITHMAEHCMRLLPNLFGSFLRSG